MPADSFYPEKMVDVTVFVSAFCGADHPGNGRQQMGTENALCGGDSVRDLPDAGTVEEPQCQHDRSGGNGILFSQTDLRGTAAYFRGGGWYVCELFRGGCSNDCIGQYMGDCDTVFPADDSDLQYLSADALQPLYRLRISGLFLIAGMLLCVGAGDPERSGIRQNLHAIVDHGLLHGIVLFDLCGQKDHTGK